MKKYDGLKELLDFLDHLQSVSMFYKLSAATERAIMVEIAVPSERWEVEFFEDRDPRVEVFKSTDGVKGSEKLEELFERFSD